MRSQFTLPEEFEDELDPLFDQIKDHHEATGDKGAVFAQIWRLPQGQLELCAATVIGEDTISALRPLIEKGREHDGKRYDEEFTGSRMDENISAIG